MDLRLAGVAEPLHLTDRHRLFSATRQDWIPASDLRAGEDLATRSGTTRIQSVSATPGTHRVFNIEAESEHCFFAGSEQVLSHNMEPCGTGRNHRHHSDPKFMGGDELQKLTDTLDDLHRQLHSDLNEHLFQKRDDFGNHMRPQSNNSGERIRGNFSRDQRLNALAEFYRKNKSNYPAAASDFFTQHPDLR